MKRWISWNCHDCGVKEGEIHHYGCDMEKCPFCGRQLIGCDCRYKRLGIDASKGTWTYKHGLTEEQERLWLEKLEQKGRIPYLLVPNMCALCGYQWPDFWAVSDKTWKKYAIPELQDKELCRDCFKYLKGIFPKGWKRVD